MVEGKEYSAGLGDKVSFYKEYIVYGKNKTKYNYSQVTKLKITKNTGWGKNKGLIEFKIGGWLCQIWFTNQQYDEMNELYDYINKKNDEMNNKEYRYKCNVCGKIFCYNENDIKDNAKKQIASALGTLGTITSGFIGTKYEMYEQNKIVNNASEQITDYSRCPYCGSKDLSEYKEQNEIDRKIEIDSFEVIKKYKELLDQGIISQEEFDEKKKELLNL